MKSGEIGEIFSEHAYKASSYNQKIIQLFIPDCKKNNSDFLNKILL